MVEAASTLIVFATPGQANLLKKTDTLAQFPLVKFGKPGTAFFEELFRHRIQGTHEEEAIYPFREEAVEQLTSISGFNPREFIRLCSLVLTEMWVRKMKEPCSLDFLKKLNIDSKPPDANEALEEALDALAENEARWVNVKEIQKTILEKRGLQLDLKSIGRMLSALGCQRRYNPDAEYLLPPTSS